ncbi:protein windpipe [Zophobas morio]|uniref:protein windpipe n=1 Tax=Zophobas morio TaxID=2755281 RepID=UPI003082AAE4
MKLIVIATTVLHLAWGASIVDITCPDTCTCQIQDEHLETSCVSYEFIKKLIPKQESTIVRLNINDASLVNVDLKLKYLKNLNSLDLSRNTIPALPSQFPYLPKLRNFNISNNQLRDVTFSQLPKNLRIIDLSHNSIANFPKDWSSLKQLEILHFHDNPIDCDCDNLAIYEQLLKGGIVIPESLTCYSPKEFHGRSLNSVNCSLIKENLLNSMLGDQELGSGAEDFDTHEEYSKLAEEDEEFFKAEQLSTEHVEDELEGSGDEGSGFIPILPIPEKPKACHFNCSTPRPIGLDDEKNASPPPSVQEQAKILFEDVILPEQVTTPTTPAPVPEAETEPQKEKEPVEIDEMMDKRIITNDVETVPTNDTIVSEMERASFENSSSKSVYIIVGLLIAFVSFLLVYYINKKRNQKKRNNRKRNKSHENGFGEEMKPLGKSAEVQKPVEQLNSKLPESAPLLNGQNGKIADENNVKSPPENDEDDLENVELRKPDKEESLTPQPERVTIKAGELPDSVPKTPLLVQRHVNSDGEIVTTAVNSD